MVSSTGNGFSLSSSVHVVLFLNKSTVGTVESTISSSVAKSVRPVSSTSSEPWRCVTDVSGVLGQT